MNIEDILGKKIRISIDEPWNFKLPSGGKKFTGVIKGSCNIPGKSNKDLKNALLIDIETPFLWDEVEIKQITASPRYYGHSLKDVIDGKELIVGILAVKEQYINKQDRIFLMEHLVYFAIGSIAVIS